MLVRQLEEGLGRRGHEVTVVSYGDWLRDRTGMHWSRPILDATTLLRLLRAGYASRPDVIHAHNYEGGAIGIAAAALLGRPLVFHGHALMRDELPSYARSVPMQRVSRAVGGWLDRSIPKRADHCVVVTPALAEELRRQGARRVTVLEPFADVRELESLGPTDPEDPNPTLVYAGNLDGYQNLELLRAAFVKVREVMPATRLLVVTHARAGGEALVRVPGVEVARVDGVREAWRQIGRGWVAIVPRIDPSGYPMKVLNYMAAGKVVVTTAPVAAAIPGCAEGGVVTAEEPESVASAVVGLLRDDERRRRLGKAARESVMARAGGDAALATLEDVYAQVAHSRAEAPARETIVRRARR